MTQFNTDHAAREAKPEPGNRIVRGLHNVGDLVYTEAMYELVGTEAANDTIRICRNKPELNLIPHLTAVDAEDPGTAFVIDVGDDADDDKYADGIILSSGGTVLFSVNSCAQKVDPVISTDMETQGEWIYATVKTATSLTAGAQLRFRLVFSANS